MKHRLKTHTVAHKDTMTFVFDDDDDAYEDEMSVYSGTMSANSCIHSAATQSNAKFQRKQHRMTNICGASFCHISFRIVLTLSFSQILYRNKKIDFI